MGGATRIQVAFGQDGSPSKTSKSVPCIHTNQNNAQFFPVPVSPLPVFGVEGLLLPSSWSAVCSSADRQARQPRDSPLLIPLHTRAGEPHYPSAAILRWSRNAHTHVPPCYKQQPRGMSRRTRPSSRRLCHNPCSPPPVHLLHKPPNLHHRNQSAQASRMLFNHASHQLETR